ncbi:hypothetical protein Tco_0088219 [Tanacetum coccineum]
MKRPTKGYSGKEVGLFPTMLDVSEPSTSPSRITSSPSHSHEPSPLPEPPIKHTPAPSFDNSPNHTTPAPTQPSPTQPSPTQPSTRAEHHFPTPHDSPLQVVHSHGSDEGSLKLNELTDLVTKLSERNGLEARVKIRKARRRAKVVLSDEDVEDDYSKQGRKLTDAKVQEKASTETEPFIQEVTPIEVIQDQGSSEKGSAEVSTAGAKKGTASEVPVLDDQDGVTSIPNSEIFEQLALMGYHTDSDKLTFQKGAFSPQWRFLIHNILYCLSPKKTACEQFSSNIATAVICLATNRFIQICLDMQRNQLQQHSRTYHVPSLSIKVFNNTKRPTKGYSGQEVALFPTMLDVSEPSTSPSRITSLPSHSPEPSPSPEPPIKHTPAPSFDHSPDHTTAAPTQPSPTQPSPT